MPEKRGSMREDNEIPDTKVPVTYVPRSGQNSSTRISVIVQRLNLGDFNSRFHYGAMAYVSNIKKYVLFYRVATHPWTVDQFVVLKKYKEASLDMIDGSKKIQDLINKCQGLIPVRNTRKRKIKNSKKSRTLKNN